MKQEPDAEEYIRRANRNFERVFWLWKWLILPMWFVIALIWMIRAWLNE